MGWVQDAWDVLMGRYQTPARPMCRPSGYVPTPKPVPGEKPVEPAIEVLKRIRPHAVWHNGMERKIGNRRHPCDEIHWVLAPDVYMVETDDDMDFTEMTIFVNGSPELVLKDKHCLLWTMVRGDAPDMTPHPSRYTFGVYGYKPLDTQADFDALRPQHQRLLNLLAAAFEFHENRAK